MEALLVKQHSSSISGWMQDTINLPFMWGEAVLCDSLMSLRVCRSKESWTALMRLRILSTKLKALPLDKPTGSLELLPSHKSWHWNAEPVSKISLRYARLSESHHSNDWRTEALCVFCWHFLLIGLAVLSYLLLDGSVATSQDMLRRTKDIMVAGSKLSVPWLHRSTGLSFETWFFWWNWTMCLWHTRTYPTSSSPPPRTPADMPTPRMPKLGASRASERKRLEG